MANKNTLELIKSLVDDIVENTQGLISADTLKSRLIDIVQSRGLFEVYSSSKVYEQNEHISFTDNNVYKCIEVTEIGQNPTTHPAKWQIIGATSTVVASAVAYTNHGYSNVEAALDAHELSLQALIPDAPDGIESKIISMVFYTALEAGTGTQKSNLTDDDTPDGVIYDVYNAQSGALTSKIDSVDADVVPLDSSDNSGTYGSIIIVQEKDPYEGQVGQGFYKVLDAIIRSVIGLSIGEHTYQLLHSQTGASAILTFVVDNPGIPVVQNSVILSLPASATRRISGVPMLQDGDNIDVDYVIDGCVGTHYNETKVAELSGNEIYTVNVAPPATPPGIDAALDLINAVTLKSGLYDENVIIQIRGFNSKGVAGAYKDVDTNVYVDDVSDESSRRTAGDDQYPTSGYGDPFDSTLSLKTANTYELQIKNGKYQTPNGDYQNNAPTPGEDYDDGMGTNWRYCEPIAPIGLNNASGLTIVLHDTENFSSQETPDLRLYIKVEGVTGWLDANKAFSLVGSPIADGDPCMVLFDSTASSKRVSFGDTLRSGLLHIRIGLPPGDDKKFSQIVTVENIV